jgi:hypothetical protein
MKKVALVFLVLLAACRLSGCNGAQRKLLEQNRSLWESKTVRHYRFNFKIGCMCPWTGMMPVAVEVQEGAIVSMVASNGGDITPYLDTFRPRAMVEGLFDTVDSAISKGVYKLEVSYDAVYGYPATIHIDQSRTMMDDTTGYYVTDFEVLP